jgi:hypothetical protein
VGSGIASFLISQGEREVLRSVRAGVPEYLVEMRFPSVHDIIAAIVDH